MNVSWLLLCIFATTSIVTTEALSKGKVRRFPDNFWFGASTSAYQVEGAWQEDGKSLSIWDVAVHSKPFVIKDGSTGDEAANSYENYRRDVEVAKELGLDFYKFSISWTRVLPNGFADSVNQLGVQYYDNLINDILDKGMQPFVTIYHWDLPVALQNMGGWLNPLVADWFVDYANILFSKFANKVKYWITINDPKAICVDGYGTATKAPMLNVSGVGEYVCAKNVLLAHARAYHLYDEHYRKRKLGTIGLAINFVWYEPASEADDDYQAATDARMFDWGMFAHPIFTKSGDFPQEVKKIVASKSAEQNFPRSRLPELSVTELTLIRGSADFLGVNHYTTKLVYRDASLEGMYPVPSFFDDRGAVVIKDPTWTQSASNWLQQVPWGFLKLLLEIKKLYDNPPIYVTENGWSTKGGLLDEDRISYLRAYLEALLDGVAKDCDIKGYGVWSLIDTFQWVQGYTEKFGLYEVDFASADKTRTPRKSAHIYKEIVRSKSLDPDYEPEKFLVEPSNEEKPKNYHYQHYQDTIL